MKNKKTKYLSKKIIKDALSYKRLNPVFEDV